MLMRRRRRLRFHDADDFDFSPDAFSCRSRCSVASAAIPPPRDAVTMPPPPSVLPPPARYDAAVLPLRARSAMFV